MLKPDSIQAAPEITSLDASSESTTTQLYRAAIGPINRDYYLPILARFEETDKIGVSWNWSACLYTLNWMIFRRLWGAALIYAAAVLCAGVLVLGIGGLLLHFSDAQEMSLWLIFGTACFVVPGILGNALLHAASRRRMENALTASNTLNEACVMLSRQASSRRDFIWLVACNLALAGILAGAYMAVQSSARSTPRAMATGMTQPAELRASEKPAPVLVPGRNSSSPPTAMPVAPVAQAAQAAPQGVQASTPSTLAAPAPVPTASKAFTAVQERLAPDQTPILSKRTGRPYYINVGLFASDSNARNAHAKLIEAGLVSFRQALKSGRGKLTRVRVGPFDSQDEADAAVEKIRALKLDAVVVQQ